MTVRPSSSSLSLSSSRSSSVTAPAFPCPALPFPTPTTSMPSTPHRSGKSSSNSSPHTPPSRNGRPSAVSPSKTASTRKRKATSRSVSPRKKSHVQPPTPPPEPKSTEPRMPQVHMHNVQHLLAHHILSPPTPASEHLRCIPSSGEVTLDSFIALKEELFPDTKLLMRRSGKPLLKLRESTSSIDDVGSEPASPPRKVYGITLPSPSKGMQNGTRSGNADAVDNWQAPRGPVTAEEAWKWKAVIGRLVKGKARLTPEVLGEVAAAIGEIEARNATPGAFTQDILEDGLMRAVKMLAEAQDNVYSLEGLRTRARALVDGWKWAIRR